MKFTDTDKFEVVSDGKTVWVNAHDGICVGRFGAFGVDVHLDYEGQMNSGRECIDCFPRTKDAQADWERFTGGMLMHYGVAIPDIHKTF